MAKKRKQIYASIIEKIFASKFKPGMKEVDFEREDIVFGVSSHGLVADHAHDLAQTVFVLYQRLARELQLGLGIKQKAGHHRAELWSARM